MIEQEAINRTERDIFEMWRTMGIDGQNADILMDAIGEFSVNCRKRLHNLDGHLIVVAAVAAMKLASERVLEFQQKQMQ